MPPPNQPIWVRRNATLATHGGRLKSEREIPTGVSRDIARISVCVSYLCMDCEIIVADAQVVRCKDRLGKLDRMLCVCACGGGGQMK